MDQLSSVRRAVMPVDHLVAEMAAMPLGSPAALELGLTRLASFLPDEMAQVRTEGGHRHDTAELWRHTERQLLQAFPAVSLEELVAIRDWLWFQPTQDTDRTIGAYLARLAGMFLRTDGSLASPTLPPEHLGKPTLTPTSAESRRTLRWLTLALPPDLLCAAATRGDDALDLAMMNPALGRMLGEGRFAELHLHLGAALAFTTIWSVLVANLGAPDFTADAFTSPGAELDEGRALAEWVLRAGIVRLVLAKYLVSGTGPGLPSSGAVSQPARFVSLDEVTSTPENLGLLAELTHPADIEVLSETLTDVRRGRGPRDRPCFAALQHVYRQMLRGLAPSPSSAPARSPGEAESLDPLARILPLPPRHRTGRTPARSARSLEQRLIRRAMRHIEDVGDPVFARLFWQVVRVRCLTYRHIVQRPMTPGLQWFVRFYHRAEPARRRLSWTAYLESAADLDGRGRGLMSLEVRRSPDDTLQDNMRFLRETAEWATRGLPSAAVDPAQRFTEHGLSAFLEPANAGRPDAPLEVGVVLHFPKDRGGGTRAGLPSGSWSGTFADPELHGGPARPIGANAAGMRYSAFYLRQRAKAIALARTLQRWPRTLLVLRGLDVCTDELGVPSWVMRPLLERVRSGAALAGIALERLGEGPAPLLRTTAHAGEDFVHLATGLRGVDEAIEHLGLREGDRIGHGIALGVNATRWAQQVGRVAVPRETRMWDLLWEWTWIASHGGGGVPRHAVIEHELSRLSESIVGRILQPYELELLRGDLLDSEALWLAGWPHDDLPVSAHLDNGGTAASSATPTASRLGLLRHYLRDAGVFRRGHHVEWVDPSDEAPALEYLQDGLRDKIARLGLTIEVNPTSNTLIGDLGSLTQHPMWRLDPPKADVAVRPVAICVGTDDPLMFASSLLDEYDVLYDGLMEGGLTDAEAREWLERVRRRGVEARFTVDPADIRPITGMPNPLSVYPSQVI